MATPDPQLQQILQQCERFGHREHVQLAWTYLHTLPREQAREAMRRSIRHLAQAHDAPDRYHETLTMAWMDVVELHLDRGTSGESFDEFIEHNGRLLDRHLLQYHYSKGLLDNGRARQEYVAPDLRPFPALT